ncbi:MAG TPA: AI-2E family transporter [Acidimicrobiales bacterium]
MTEPGRPTVHPAVERVAAYSWRLLVIAGAFGLVLWFAGRVWPALLPLVIAALLGRALWLPNSWLRSRGLPPPVAAAATVLGFLAVLSGLLALASIALAGEFDGVGTAITEAVDDVEEWLVDDSPFDVSRADIDRFREQASESIREALRTSSSSIIDATVLAGEVLLGIILGLIVTFFLLKDGHRFAGWVNGLLPEERRGVAAAMGSRAWETLGGYLRGAALLGIVEGAGIAIALTIVGAELALPMAMITFLAAFVPFAGATLAGVLAVLVALGTAGAAQAGIVAIIALAIQQLDNDVLAPVVYGRSLALHPLVIILSVVAGGALLGLVGGFLAVPVVAVVVNAIAEARAHARAAAAPVAPPEADAGAPAPVV